MTTISELETILNISRPEDVFRDLWIWGTGNTAEMLQEGLKRWDRFPQIKGYVDSNPQKAGKTFYGKPIVSPETIKNEPSACVLICTNQSNYLAEIKEQLQNMGGVHWYVLEDFVLYDLRKRVLDTFKLFEDDKSKELFSYLVKCKKNGEYPSSDSGLLDIEHGYFSMPEFAQKNDNEVFVDVGCYIGDTIEEYLSVKGNSFKKIYSFEPDPVSFEKARENVKRLCEELSVDPEKISILPYGVGGKTETGVFERFEESEGTGSKFVTGKSSDEESLTKIVALDDFIEEGFSFLKADVESYEYQVIMGASKTIQKCKPKMAICLYHNVFDFIQLPGIIKDLVPDYRLYLRQHAASWFDTVVYAVEKAQP